MLWDDDRLHQYVFDNFDVDWIWKIEEKMEVIRDEYEARIAELEAKVAEQDVYIESLGARIFDTAIDEWQAAKKKDDDPERDKDK